MMNRAIVLLIVLMGLITQAGCSAFKSSKRLNLAPFAEDMIAVAGDIQYGLGETYSVYLRGYSETPEAEQMVVMATKIRAIIRGSIAYALEVVSLADSRLTGPQRTHALADKVESLMRPVLAPPAPPLNLTNADLDTILADIRSRDNLLDGLSAAQPVINEIARVSGEISEETKRTLDAAAAAVQLQISEDIAPVLEHDRMLRNYQLIATGGIALVAQIRGGNSTAMDSLVVLMPGVADFASTEDGLTTAEMRAIEERLIWALETVSNVRKQLYPDIELYWKQQVELENLVASFNKALRQARVAIIAWSRAHQRLASGITDPAEIDIFGIAKKAAGDFLPVP